jgi:phage shock protein A
MSEDPVPCPEPAPPVDTGYTPAGIPTFESVREKIENRFGTALGASELASETAEGRDADKRYEATKRAASERLEQIRSSMRSGTAEPGQS